MTHDISEHCTCGEALTVRGSFQGQPITHCPHCDTGIEAAGHAIGCQRCERYRKHILRYPDWRQP